MAIEINPSTPSSPIPSVNGISVIWLGNWTSNKIYRRNEGVFYNGSSYRANKTTSQTPSSLATDWDLLAQGGSGGGGGTINPTNLDELTDVIITSPIDGQSLVYDNSTGKWVNETIISSGGGSGEANTASNVGTNGVGVFKQKTGVNLEFKKLNAASNKISITDDTINSDVDIDVVEANLTLGNLTGTLPISKGGTGSTTSLDALTALGAASSTTLTSHTGNTSNPHNTTAAQVGAIPTTAVGTANGVASLDASTLIPIAQIPISIARVSQITATQAGAIATTARGTANGVASLDASTLIPIAQIPSTIARASDLTTHTSATNNPHNTTAAQVGNTTAQWNANQIQGRSVSSTAPTNGQAIVWNSTSSTWQPGTISGSGEINTASNVGSTGIGVFRQKTGVNLEFKRLNIALGNRISISDDTVNNEIDFDVNEANLSLSNIGGTLPLTKGGTGATTASAALTALGGLASTTRGAANGVASLDASTLIPIAQIPISIARVSQITATQAGAIATTARGTANGVASLDANTLVPDAQISTSIARLSQVTAAQAGAIATTARGTANGIASLDANTLIPDAQIPTSIARVSQVTASQVGNTTAQWNANQIRGANISTTPPANGQVLTYNTANTSWEPSTPSSGGSGGSGSSNDYFPGYISNRSYPLANSGSRASLYCPLDTCTYVPFYLPKGGTFNQVSFRVESGAVGNARVGIYSHNNSTALPGTLIYDSGATSVQTTGYKSINVTWAFSAGLYWFVFCSSADITISGCTSTAYSEFLLGVNIADLFSDFVGRFKVNQTFATLPTTPTISTRFYDYHFPLIYLRAA